MKFSGREKALLAAPVLALVLALAPGWISNALYRQTPDRIVVVNNSVGVIAKLRMVVYGHPNYVFIFENVAPSSRAWRLFNQNWAEQVKLQWDGSKGAMVQVEGKFDNGSPFGAEEFYLAPHERDHVRPTMLVITVENGALYPSKFHPSSRAQNESFWRDLGDVLFRQPQQHANLSKRIDF